MLKNKTIISTRPFKGNDPLINLLQAEGVSCLSMPLIKVEKNVLNNEEESLLNNLDQFNWIVFTSANGVRFFMEHG